MKRAWFCAALLLALSSALMIACRPAVDPGDDQLAKDSAAVAEVNRINEVLASARPVTRIDVDSLERLRGQYPNSSTVRRLLRAALIKREDWAAAEKLILETPEKELTGSDRVDLAKIVLKQGKFDQTIATLKTITPAESERVEVGALFGQAYFGAGSTDEAITSLESIKSDLVTQKRGDDLAVLGMSYLRRGDTAKAIEVLEQTLQIAPENISALSALVRAYNATGDIPKAETARARLQQLNDAVAEREKKRSRMVPLFYQLEDAYAAKDFAKVISLVEQIRPDADERTMPTLYQYLAAAYRAQGKEAEARQALNEAQRLTSK